MRVNTIELDTTHLFWLSTFPRFRARSSCMLRALRGIVKERWRVKFTSSAEEKLTYPTRPTPTGKRSAATSSFWKLASRWGFLGCSRFTVLLAEGSPANSASRRRVLRLVGLFPFIYSSRCEFKRLIYIHLLIYICWFTYICSFTYIFSFTYICSFAFIFVYRIS